MAWEEFHNKQYYFYSLKKLLRNLLEKYFIKLIAKSGLRLSQDKFSITQFHGSLKWNQLYLKLMKLMNSKSTQIISIFYSVVINQIFNPEFKLWFKKFKVYKIILIDLD